MQLPVLLPVNRLAQLGNGSDERVRLAPASQCRTQPRATRQHARPYKHLTHRVFEQQALVGVPARPEALPVARGKVHLPARRHRPGCRE